MASQFYANQNSIKAILEKLKREKMVAEDATFNYQDYNKLRKEVLPQDLDFQYFLKKNQVINKSKGLSKNEIIQLTIEELKNSGAIDKTAVYNDSEPHGLRKEVLYHDFDFLQLLGSIQEVEIVATILEFLKEKHIIDVNFKYDKEDFLLFRNTIKENFKAPWTTLSPTMERLLYTLSLAKKPKKILGVGIFAGYTFSWNLSDYIHNNSECVVYGVDIDPKIINVAKDNFTKILKSKPIHFICEDGCIFSQRIEETFDYIYLDADSSINGKGIYMDLIQSLYDKLEVGGWLLAHDTTNLPLMNQCQEYLKFVRDKSYFKESISFNFDLYGLELSIK